MPKRSQLLQALDHYKGRDYDAEKQKKLVRAAKKKKAAKQADPAEDVVCSLSFFVCVQI
jgi:rRNA-processing protein EBP2